jgi:hypothetical protein
MVKNLNITPGAITKFFTITVGTLLFANLLLIYSQHALGFSFHTIHIFYFNKEGNIPSIYSSLSILFCAFLLWAISNQEAEKKQKLYWKFLGSIFFFLSIDELISIHETLSDDSLRLFGKDDSQGYLYFAWIIPYLFIFGVIFIFLLKFLYRLPLKTRLLFIGAGAIFLAGAVVMEMLGGKYVFMHGTESKTDLTYALMVTFEELLEMAGIVVFIYGLSEYYLVNIKDKMLRLNINFKKDEKVISAANTDLMPNAANPDI